MKPISIVIHPGVPHSDPHKVIDLVTFARKFITEFPGEGETPVARLEPWANTDNKFAVVLGVEVPAETPHDHLHQRAKDMERFAEEHYPHFSRTMILVDPAATPATFPGPVRG